MAHKQMQFTLHGLVGAAIQTLRNPHEGARLVMAQNLPKPLLWQMLGVVVALSVVLGQGSVLLFVDQADLAGSFSVLLTPLAMAALQLVVLVVTVLAVHWIGRQMGGVGRFEDSLALMVWLQFIMICLQVVQVVAMSISTPFADIIGLVGLVLFFWLLTNFIAALHGFRSLGLVFVMILVSAVGMVFLLSLLLSLIGFTGTGEF
ncbi:MAG: YIP1 family protein [Mangrovicoccus sp.]|nr:YIP1 family protein [Mangrovicoccus sp.]